MNPSGITQVISPKMPLTDFSVWSGQLRTTYSIVHNAYAVIHHIHFQKWVRIPLVGTSGWGSTPDPARGLTMIPPDN